MLQGIGGFIVEYDIEGRDDWIFCAFFMDNDDAVEWASLKADEPTRYRIRPQQPAMQLAA